MTQSRSRRVAGGVVTILQIHLAEVIHRAEEPPLETPHPTYLFLLLGLNARRRLRTARLVDREVRSIPNEGLLLTPWRGMRWPLR